MLVWLKVFVFVVNYVLKVIWKNTSYVQIILSLLLCNMEYAFGSNILTS
jgi:hypothetical protein